MTTLLRRFLVLAALMFWQGGFTFYAAVVIPVGQQVLGMTLQPRVTGPVTHYLNLAGVVALVPLAWDTASARDPAVRRRRLRWVIWLGLALTLALLFWLHYLLAQHLGAATDEARAAFAQLHLLYLVASTLQWVCGLVFTILALLAWRGEDQTLPAS